MRARIAQLNPTDPEFIARYAGMQGEINNLNQIIKDLELAGV
jgi:hypothetical protein